MKFLYVTDTHGRLDVYERVFKKAKNFEFVVIGGDITPTFFTNEFGTHVSPQEQGKFLEGWLIPKIRDFRKKTEKDVFIMMGNDDFAINMDLLENAEKEGTLKLLHGKVHDIGKFRLGGYSCVNPIPFMLKDWERTENEIKKELQRIFGKTRLARTICVLHVPPYNTNLDVVYDSRHVGSTAILDFIKKGQPLLALHGHIHESPQMSGFIADKIRRTICVNPGNGKILSIDTEDLEGMKIIG